MPRCLLGITPILLFITRGDDEKEPGAAQIEIVVIVIHFY